MPCLNLKKRRIALISTLLISIPSSLLAAEYIDHNKELNIMDVYNMALVHDASLASAKATLDSKLEVAAQTRALFLPKIQFSADSKINDSDTVNEPSGLSPSDPAYLLANIGVGQKHYNSHGYSISLLQPLLDINSIYNKLDDK